MRLAIALPVSDEKIDTLFFYSFVILDKPDDCHLVYPRTQFHSADIGKIRTDLCHQAIDLECTHILMMDTDQVYHDQDLIERLLAHDKDITCGKVHRRYPPFEPILNVGDGHVSDEEIDKGGLIEVDATGTGCMLIRLDILKDIPTPWFEFAESDGKNVGEDINFCKKAKKAGFKIFVDCGVEIGHLATVQINESMYNMWKIANKVREL
jgi:hypothetical protein